MATEKVWYSRTNIPLPGVPATAAEYNRMMLWMWLTTVMGYHTTGDVGHTGAPPAASYATCMGSSDSVTAGMDNVFRPGSTFDQTKWVRGATTTTARTWVVLRFGAGAEKMYALFDYQTSGDSQISVWLSRVGFTGGTVSARPTATDEVQYTNLKQIAESSYTAQHRFSITTTADGYFYVVCNRTGGATAVDGLMWFQKSVGSRSGDTTRNHGFGIGHSGNITTSIFAPSTSVSAWNSASNAPAGMAPGRLNGWLGFCPASWLGPGSTAAQTAGNAPADTVDGDFDLYPVYVLSVGTNGGYATGSGGRGRLPDAHLVGNANLFQTKLGDTGLIEGVNVGGVLLPYTATVSGA